MHASSLENMYKCFQRYIDNEKYFSKNEIIVLDIGGSNVNGSYKYIFSDKKFVCKAVDMSDDDTVDIVLEDPYHLPFESSSINIVVSGQTFEHVEFFWLLFNEIMRITKDDGYFFLIAPSAGPEHKYPVDCYRYYPDSYKALAKYSKSHLIDSWIDKRGPWRDLVGIFSKFQHKKRSKETSGFFDSVYSDSFKPQFSFKEQDNHVELIKGTKNYLEILDEIHRIKKPKLYFEVGIRKGESLSLSKSDSIAIDPVVESTIQLPSSAKIFECTSDDFFETYSDNVLTNRKIDLAFIDGMHLFEFVLRDFINIEKYCSSQSIIVIDDLLPNHEIQASRVRESRVWTGDVWKIYYCLKENRPDLNLLLVDSSPTGMLVIKNLKPWNQILLNRYNTIVNKYKNLGIKEFKNELLNRENTSFPDSSLLTKFITED